MEGGFARGGSGRKKVDIDQTDSVVIKFKVKCVDDSKAHWITVDRCNVTLPFEGDYGYGTTHLIVLLAARAGGDSSGGKLNYFTVGKELIENRQMPVNGSCEEAGIIEP